MSWLALAVLCADLLAAVVLTVWLLDRGSRLGASTLVTAGDRHHALAAARHLVETDGDDSLSPFIVRPDKAFEFAAGGVLAYRVFGRTAIVSGDPVGPPDAGGAVFASFMRSARSRGWSVVVYGASARQLDTYRRLGMRAICVGEEAVARPAAFTLEGRRARKLRQSVNRVQRRGWQIVARDGVDIDAATEAEIDALEAQWRARQPRILGFAMGMGRFEGGVHPSDLYLLARSPEGRLAATMRFIAHRGKLSLDTMRRVGETPNGLNEALMCHALEVARDRGISEVSLNCAGLAHVIRCEPCGSWFKRHAIRLGVAVLGRRFQMQRLVRFNEKFAPEWRPRYLVYPSRRALPRALYHVLQAEGYLRQRDEPRRVPGRIGLAPGPAVSSIEASAPGQ
jgi:lysyl-tRNA synthetase class 2